MKVFIFCAPPQDEGFHLCALPQDEGFHLLCSPHGSIILRPQDESFHRCALPQMKFHLICYSPRWRFSSYMLLPVVKALIFCARPQDEGLNWPHTIISWACMVGLLDSSIINPLLLLLLLLRFICSFRILIMNLQLYLWYCFYRVLNRYRLIPYDWHHRCVLLLGDYWRWVWYMLVNYDIATMGSAIAYAHFTMMH